MNPNHLAEILPACIAARQEMLAAPHDTACRLFNGFLEGCPGLALDVYADTLVAFNHFNPPENGARLAQEALELARPLLPWVTAGLIKTRRSADPVSRRGILAWGPRCAASIREHGVSYAIHLTLNQDASFYLDTRLLRQWAIENLAGKTVLNTFAYTGSLGAAALAGGAARVVHIERNRVFLQQARETYRLNRFPIQRQDFLAEDFFTAASHLRRAGETFDCVFLDAPFFSDTGKGVVNLAAQSQALINKARPLVADNGWLVVVANALFLSGADFHQSLLELGRDGYLALEGIIPVPPDITGYAHTIRAKLPADPAPFNHATKIALLRLRRRAAR